MPLTAPPRRKAEPTIALINVVFLMLVFFLVAGQIAAPPDPGLSPVLAHTDPARAPDDALVIRADGALFWKGQPTTAAEFTAAQAAPGVLRIMPDRDLPARDLLGIAASLRALGATGLRVVTQQAQP